MDTTLLLFTMQKIDFPSVAENVHLVEKMIDSVCDELKVNEDHYGNILIALTEAVNNAIHHGNKLNPDKTTTVSCDLESNKLKFKVQDEGVGFDYTNLPDPTAPENIENPNGRGIFLMKNLADEIAFDNEGRIVELTFHLN
jgi:serine/threonine-protein kinase RsbW